MTSSSSPTTRPRLLDQVRQRIRVLHYSYRTEQAYVDWIRFFIRFSGRRHPRDMGKSEVEHFLSWGDPGDSWPPAGSALANGGADVRGRAQGNGVPPASDLGPRFRLSADPDPSRQREQRPICASSGFPNCLAPTSDRGGPAGSGNGSWGGVRRDFHAHCPGPQIAQCRLGAGMVVPFPLQKQGSGSGFGAG